MRMYRDIHHRSSLDEHTTSRVDSKMMKTAHSGSTLDQLVRGAQVAPASGKRHRPIWYCSGEPNLT